MARRNNLRRRPSKTSAEQKRLIEKLLRTHTPPAVVSSKAGISLAQARELARRAKTPRNRGGVIRGGALRIPDERARHL
jgi:hypothetical protein